MHIIGLLGNHTPDYIKGSLLNPNYINPTSYINTSPDVRLKLRARAADKSSIDAMIERGIDRTLQYVETPRSEKASQKTIRERTKEI